MKIGALIAEFNPLHAGHKLLIDTIKQENDAVIAVMSGNFVQRGECAVFEKYDRAKAAAANGVDLVIELPVLYCLSSAEGFAKGGVEILEKCGVVDSLYFGSECGDIDSLTKCAEVLNDENKEFSALLNEKLSEGMSFPKARQLAAEVMIKEASVLNEPNNILAVEYIRAIKKLGSEIVPSTIKRMGGGYNDTDIKSPVPSASAIRARLMEGVDVNGYMLYNYESSPTFMKDFDVITASRLKAIGKEELMLLPDCNEEIASRLKAASFKNTFEEIVTEAACRRYTQSRIRRILCNMIIGNHFGEYISPRYIRPLAFNKKGSELLRLMKESSSLPIASRGAVLKDDTIFKLECRATDIYNLIHNIEGGNEFSAVAEIIYSTQ
ncbi:MAG: nucleotidyltransferase family protein [Clostridia bacterium]|nr:nucleotidyltransferase family protein [Clostridia bacterium]